MNSRERDFLLLRSRLGDPRRHPLTALQLHELRQRVRASTWPREDRDVVLEDILRLGYDWDMAQRILDLLSGEDTLDRYARRGEMAGCVPLTQVSERYPRRILSCLGAKAPACLWAKGDLELLKMDKIALVGSRDLSPEGWEFANNVGIYAAQNGIALVSGNARGADRTAQSACLSLGGKVISVVADRLDGQPLREGVLYLSEEEYDADFSARRALSRNCVIHSMGETTYVAQCTLGKGGTWSGSVQNLRNGWSTLRCHDDGSEAMKALHGQGAILVDRTSLT